MSAETFIRKAGEIMREFATTKDLRWNGDHDSLIEDAKRVLVAARAVVASAEAILEVTHVTPPATHNHVHNYPRDFRPRDPTLTSEKV